MREAIVHEDPSAGAPCVSIGIIAWNEERVIEAALRSLFRQSVFEWLARSGLKGEILCVANGCTDGTAAAAERVLREQSESHPFARAFDWRVCEIAERGKINAWNRFVHEFSAQESRYLMLMDADIIFHRERTLENMMLALETDPQANIAVDEPCKHVGFKARASVRDRVSLGASELTGAGEAQMTAQLYCIRSAAARNIHLPRALSACEDGLIKWIVCTDSLTRPLCAERIVLAPDAAHVFEAYTSLRDVVRNQKRQVIGQTMVHLLVDRYLPRLSLRERLNLAETLRDKEKADPQWLERLVTEHVRQVKHFWRLYPDVLTVRFNRWKRLGWRQRLACLPAALAGSCLGLLAAHLAYRHLKQGQTGYWPHAQRGETGQLERLAVESLNR